MSKLHEYAASFIECMKDNMPYQPSDENSSYYRKPRPEVLKRGQVWTARLLRPWTNDSPHVDFNFVLTYVSEQQDHCKGFLLIDGLQEDVLLLADTTDVPLPYHESPIDAAIIMTWRGEVNLAPDHLKWYYGDVTEAQLREADDKYVPVITQQREAPTLNPDLQPIRDLLWKLTAEFDGEALDKVLQD